MTENNQEKLENTQETAHAQNTEDQHDVNTDTEQATEDENLDNLPASKASREAAKYRTQLRETETRLETVNAQRDAIAAQAVEHYLPNDLPPTAFWRLTDGVQAFMTDDGTIDGDKVAATADQLRTELNLPAGPVIPGQEKRAGKIRASNGLEQAFKPK